MRVTCRGVQNLLFDYAASELPPDVVRAFREHLCCCSSCALDVESYQCTIRLALDAYSDEPIAFVPLDLVFAVLTDTDDLSNAG
jgi:hypothetical protein